MRVLLLAWATLSSLQASSRPVETTPQPSPEERIATSADQGDRMRVAVRIGGHGPFRFVVDTGAERTVVSREIAEALKLSHAGTVRLTSLAETSDVPSVTLRDVQVGQRRFTAMQAPAISHESLGAEGLLGLDALEDQTVVFDFRRQELSISPSRRRAMLDFGGAIIVQARSRYGRLVVSNAELEGRRVTVIIDTGSQVTLGNAALRRAIGNRIARRGQQAVPVWGVTGPPFLVNFIQTKDFKFGALEIQDLPIAFGSAHLFESLDLVDRPALLLGMDALRLFDRVSIDFATNRLRLLPRSASSGSPSDYAADRSDDRSAELVS